MCYLWLYTSSAAGWSYSNLAFSFLSCRTPAMIGCSFVVDREYFGEIGLLDPGMEVYGGENIELGMRVRTTHEALFTTQTQTGSLKRAFILVASLSLLPLRCENYNNEHHIYIAKHISIVCYTYKYIEENRT